MLEKSPFLSKPSNSAIPVDKVIAAADASAMAENSAQASKNIYPGTVSVNLQTGYASVQFDAPGFSDLNISLSYSGLASQYESPFGLPAGVNLQGIPYIHKSYDNHSALNINGQDYYIDDKYCSIMTEGENAGERYYSGLKYQASKNIRFINHTSESVLPVLKIYTRTGGLTTYEYRYELKILSGDGELSHYFFDEYGFCIALVNKYFVNGQDDNYKYLTLIEYDNGAVQEVVSSTIKSITNGDGKQTLFTYENGKRDIRLSYPKGAAGEQYEIYLLRRSSSIIMGHSLNTQYDYQLTIETDESDPRVFWVQEALYELATEDTISNKRYSLEYNDQENPFSVTRLRIIDEQDPQNILKTDYEYQGDRTNSFSYGFDEAFVN